jgi:hypothetical protein
MSAAAFGSGIAVIALASVVSILMLWNLGEKYLWQDEACTAVLAQRLLKFGKPLAYDGTNLVTTDHFRAEDMHSIEQRTTSAKAAIDYYVGRGDLKEDTTWKWQPWGQFIVAGVSFSVLGNSTTAARLPFALAGLAAVLLLYIFVRRHFNSVLMGTIAAAMLTFNSYWVLHGRQCRYYSLSSLFLLLTVMGYAHWQWTGRRWGAAWFVLAAWGWFQIDYGTIWPVICVLLIDAAVSDLRRWKSLVCVGIALTIAVGPFVVFYDLAGRLAFQMGTWNGRFVRTLFGLNHYVVPILILVIAFALVAWRWRIFPSAERRMVVICIGIFAGLLLWVPSVAPMIFLRYTVIAAPLGCLLGAWVVVRSFHLLMYGQRKWANSLVLFGAAVLILTPWPSIPLSMTLPVIQKMKTPTIFREEISTLFFEVFGSRPDPNRVVIDWLRQHALPGDEILINYEDVPLMFYLPNPIRGGLSAFRVEDEVNPPPRFLVLRRSWAYTHWPAFMREVNRYQWQEVPVEAPDVLWGNNPDPLGMAVLANIASSPSLLLFERL